MTLRLKTPIDILSETARCCRNFTRETLAIHLGRTHKSERQ
jgi:hypothetical protein